MKLAKIDLNQLLSFLSFSEKSPSGPTRIQIGPISFFDKEFFKSLLLQLISQKTKHPFLEN